jgi:hypothetical protein
MTIALRCDDPRLALQWSAAARRFLVSDTPADVELTVRGVENNPPHDGDLIFESGGVWRLFRDGDGFRVECHAPVFANNPYKIARFDASFTRGEILLTRPVWHLGPLDYPLDELLVIHLLGRGRGVEFHSCGIIDHSGRGRLFVGMSGAGKTTTARLWVSAAAAIVSDDRVIVREHDGGMRMFGTPWHGEGELSLPASAPLTGVYLLTQSSSNEIRALSHPEAVARLFGCVFPPFHDAAAVEFTLAFLDKLAQQVPVRELAFTRDASVVDLVLAEAA